MSGEGAGRIARLGLNEPNGAPDAGLSRPASLVDGQDRAQSRSLSGLRFPKPIAFANPPASLVAVVAELVDAQR